MSFSLSALFKAKLRNTNDDCVCLCLAMLTFSLCPLPMKQHNHQSVLQYEGYTVYCAQIAKSNRSENEKRTPGIHNPETLTLKIASFQQEPAEGQQQELD